MNGRPTKYTLETVRAICMRLIEGESLRSICRHESLPSMSTVMNWLSSNPDFLEQYARARDFQADTLADEILDTADTEEDVNRAKLRIDARKWTASKLKPKKYGSFQQIEEIRPPAPVASESMAQAVGSVVQLLQSIR